MTSGFEPTANTPGRLAVGIVGGVSIMTVPQGRIAWLEERRRIDVEIASTSASHMSNAKWRKAMQALIDLAVGSISWKFIDVDRIFVAEPSRSHGVPDTRIGDSPPSPYAEYREIEWIEIPAEHADEVETYLAKLGRFPVERIATGLRIVGYRRDVSA